VLLGLLLVPVAAHDWLDDEHVAFNGFSSMSVGDDCASKL